MSAQKSILILGIGNVLWADEGFGVRTVETLARRYSFPESVTLMDGGTQGLYLLEHVQAADVLIVFDAVDYGLSPGSLKYIEGDDVPNYLGAKKMSLHQTGFQEVLATAEMLGDSPEQIMLIGVQPEELEDYGGSLCDSVKAQIEPAIRLALQALAELGIHPNAKQPDDEQAKAALDLARYEAERPSATDALRKGDARIVFSKAYEMAPRAGLADAISVDVDHRGKY